MEEGRLEGTWSLTKRREMTGRRVVGALPHLVNGALMARLPACLGFVPVSRLCLDLRRRLLSRR